MSVSSDPAPPPSPGRRAQQSEATRTALLRAARELFATRGYAAVGTEELVQRAGVTRGALYHHFRDKADLFRALHEEVEQEIVASIAAQIGTIEEPRERLTAGVRVFLDVCTDPALMQIALIDGPAVLGWQAWREIGAQYGLGLMTVVLENAMEAGVMRRTDVQPLGHLLLGAVGEAALLVANARDRPATRNKVEQALTTLIDGLAIHA